MVKSEKKPVKPSFLIRVQNFLGTERFWYIVLGFFVFCAGWIAITSLYPMAFDEEVHLGTIRAYSEAWSPYSLVQKTAYDDFGAIITDPSYLFHFLMSFPYRFITLFTHNEPVIVVLLRFINIGFFAVALILFRKVLLTARISRASAHVVLAILVLIPVVPLLAGQINYDNLVMLATAALLLAVLRTRQGLRSNEHNLVAPLALATCFALFGSIVKYAFVPIALAAGLYVFIEIVLAFHRDGKKLFKRCQKEIQSLARPALVGLITLLVIGFGMFSQRYVVNMVRYGAPVPDCAKVLSVERCMAYSPWARNYRFSNDPSGVKARSLPHFTATYFAHGMWHRLYFTLAGPTNGYFTRKELPIPSRAAIFVVLSASVFVLVFARSIFREHPEFWLFLLVAVCYIGILLNQLYGDYMQTTRAVAINGRYLLPLLPGLGAIGIVAYGKFFNRAKIPQYKGIFAAVVLIVFLQGGGALTYMVSSEPRWYWPSPIVQNVTNTARNALQPILVGEQH